MSGEAVRTKSEAKYYWLESLISANSSSQWLKQYKLCKIYPAWSGIQTVKCHISRLTLLSNTNGMEELFLGN